mgnify:CR=1 FL=1
MPRPFPDKYTLNHRRLEDGAVAFDCTQDSGVWPWLALPAIHPILVQTINFWGSIDSGEFLGTFDPDAWTALTQVEWTCGPPDVGLPAHGVYRSQPTADPNRAHYGLTFYDDADRLVADLSGQGVTFRTRNFEGWREDAKEKLKPPAAPAFDYAPKDVVGVEAQSQSFLAPLSRGDSVATTGLITKQNGLRPNHPYIGGSGDHVNSTHMGEIGRQFGELLLGRAVRNTGGAIRFDHYVELGAPFEVDQIVESASGDSFSAGVSQNGRTCTEMTMTYRFSD